MPIKPNEIPKDASTSKKISLSTKRSKVTNSAVLEFIDSNSKKPTENSLVSTCETAQKNSEKPKLKDATQSIQFLKENHPEDK